MIVAGERPEKRPLSGRRILVTRGADRAGPWCDALARAGARPVARPLLRTEGVRAPELAARAARADWIVFTSAEAVRRFGQPTGTAKIACVGELTAEQARRAGWVVEPGPEEASASGLARSLVARGIDGANVLFPCAEGARDVLPRALRGAGAVVERIHLYRTVAEAVDVHALERDMVEGSFDALTFASPSAVEVLFAQLSEAGRAAVRRVPCAALGESTAEALRKWQGSADIVPERPDIESLVAALETYFCREGR